MRSLGKDQAYCMKTIQTSAGHIPQTKSLHLGLSSPLIQEVFSAYSTNTQSK